MDRDNEPFTRLKICLKKYLRGNLTNFITKYLFTFRSKTVQNAFVKLNWISRPSQMSSGFWARSCAVTNKF